MDVIKTRIQAATVLERVGGWTLVGEMVKKEGMGSFFKVLPLLILGIDTEDTGGRTKIDIQLYCCSEFDTSISEGSGWQVEIKTNFI